jgi:AraC family transcriptional regulator
MTPTHLTYRQRILTVQLHIQEHLDEELSLDRLARVAHFSPYHFHRLFRALVGETVTEYVRRLRLESAAVALKTGEKSVLEVALDAGYGTHEAFTRAFRQMFGVSPTQFRAGRNPLYTPQETEPMTTAAPTHDVRTEDVPPRRVAFIRHVGPYGSAGPAFARLMPWAGRKGLLGPGTVVLGICHDDPEVTPADKIRFDCCVTVPDHVQPEGEVGVQTVEGGPYAVLRHVGPYDKLGAAYRWLYGTWLPTSGRELRHAPAYEVYVTSPQNTAPDKLVTDIYMPLEAR